MQDLYWTRVGCYILSVGAFIVAGEPRLSRNASFGTASELVTDRLRENTKRLDNYRMLPLRFEPNVGQFDPAVTFAARAPGYTLFLTNTDVVMALSRRKYFGPNVILDHLRTRSQVEGIVMRMRFAGARKPIKSEGLDKLTGVSNYFIGNESRKWHTDVPNFAEVRLKDVYPGIDASYHGNRGWLEYDFVVAPQTDPSLIRMAWQGVDSLKLDAEGNLVLGTQVGDVVYKRPRAYQDIHGQRVGVPVRYLISRSNFVTFALAIYDRRKPVIIDPVLAYSTYLGGSYLDYGSGIAVDAAGAAYVTGYTLSADFPTKSPYQIYRGNADVFVTKLAPTGNAIVYSTYLGGSGDDQAYGIAVDAEGAAYVTGATVSPDFPTQTPYQTYQGNSDVFVTKLSPTGNALVYSTYLGGRLDDSGTGIAVDMAGSAYITGTTLSFSFPTQPPNQVPKGQPGNANVFVTKLSIAGNALVYSTYLSGSSDDYGSGIAVDAAGSVYVTGYTNSIDFPVQAPYETSLPSG